MSSEATNDFSLHKAVLKGDVEVVKQLLKTIDESHLNKQDIHGNTALLIAVMKGNRQCIELLLANGAIPTIRNELNWMSIQEAISFGDTHIVKTINDAIAQRMARYLKREYIHKVVKDIAHDFIIKFNVRLKDYNHTTVLQPPKVDISIAKKGLKVNVHLRVTECFHSNAENFHLIFNLNEDNNNFIQITIGENLPFYQNVTFEEWDAILNEIFSRESSNDEIQSLLRKENISTKIDKECNRTVRPLFRKTVTKTTANYKTDVYESQGLNFTTRTRSEHLLARSQVDGNEPLPPPTNRDVSWDQYINAPKGEFPYLGRETIVKTDTKRVSIVVGLTEQISFEWKWIIEVAEQILGKRCLQLISQLVKELPNGFPVLLEFPVKPMVQMKVKLTSFEANPQIDDNVFAIPDNYEQRVIFRIERND